MSDKIEGVRAIVAEAIDRDAAEIPASEDRDNIDGWDSLAHLRVITAFEEHYGIRLTMQQIGEIRSVSDLARYIE